jgi:hypothetical protein
MVPAEAAERRPKLQIINGTAKTVDVFWLADEGKRVPQGAVAPGDDTVISTTIGHRFAIVPTGGDDETLITSKVPIQAYQVGGMPSFYSQQTEVNGFPIVASDRVNPYALKEAVGKEDLVTLIVPKGQGHTVWEGFFRCQELVDVLIARAKGR